jgi:YegS/Rv2252/BmrU family lipid kinase
LRSSHIGLLSIGTILTYTFSGRPRFSGRPDFHLKLASNNPESTDTTLPLVIVNPKSAGGATQGKWAGTASELRAHFGPFAVEFTKKAGDGIAIAERAAREGRRLIIACGGDGTINEVANGIIASGTDAELGVVPSGTGGDFRRTLGISSDPRSAAAALRDGITKSMDVIRVRYRAADGRDAERYCLNISSVGLAASVITRVKSSNAFDWIPVGSVRGQANFALSALQEILDPDAVTVRVRIDGGDERSVRTICLCVANARFFGGGMKIAPNARLTDGLFDVVNVSDMSSLKIVLNAHSLYRGTHLGLDEVSSKRAKMIEIRPDDTSTQTPIEIDGEMPGTLPALYTLVPKAIRIRVPRRDGR